jgi:hypothetical protein
MTPVTVSTVLWRRLDVPGHDACRLEQTAGGWAVDGAAVFSEDGLPARLAYRVDCDDAWRSTRGVVQGWLGARSIALEVARTSGGGWTLDGRAVTGLEPCVDLDLGFTPATNLLQLRRIGLFPGDAADVPVAWLDAAAGTLDLLQQRYERRSETTYWYGAPGFRYAALLEVGPDGFVRRYPGLWEAATGEADGRGGRG